MSDESNSNRELVEELDKLRKNNKELREKEELYRAIGTNAFGLMTLYDFETNQLIWANDNWQKVLGYRPDDVDDPLEFIHPDDRRAVIEAITSIQKDEVEEVNDLECRYKKSSDDYLNFKGSAKKMKINDRMVIFSTIKNITEYKKAEEELNNIFELSPDMLCVCTPEGEFLKVNPSCAKILGYSVDDILKLGWANLVHPDDLKITDNEVRNQEKGESVRNFTNRFRCGDGTYKTLEWQATPVINGIVYATARDITERMRAEVALRKSEERLKSFMDSSTDSFILYDSNLNFELANKIAFQFMKSSLEGLIGKNIKEISPGIEKSERYAKYIEVMRTGTPFFVEDLIPNKKYGDIHVYVKAFKVGDGLGLIFTDITERKRAEETLRESEEKYRSLFEIMTPGVVYQDAEGKIISANPAAEQILGLTFEQMTGRTSIDPRWRSIQEDGSDFLGDMHPSMIALKKGEKVNGVIMGVFNPKKGGYKWININAVPHFRNGEDSPFQVHTTFVDITKRKQAEEALKESEEKFRSIFENAPVGIDIAGKDGTPLKVNRKFEELLGYSESELLKIKYTDYTHSDDIENSMRLVKDILDGKKDDVSIQKRYIHKTGKVVWAHTHVSAVHDTKGELQYFITMIEDITQQKIIEEEMKMKLMKYNLDNDRIYLVKESSPALLYEAINDLLNIGKTGLLLSRSPLKDINEHIHGNFEYLMLGTKKGKNIISPNLEKLKKLIDKVSPNKFIVIDRLDYLIMRHGFKKVILFLQNLRERSMMEEQMIILSIDPSTLRSPEISLLQKETLEILPRIKLEISKKSLDILKIIYQQNIVSVNPSYSDIETKLNLSKPTLRKRLKKLIFQGYINETQVGRSKNVELTESGRNLIVK